MDCMLVYSFCIPRQVGHGEYIKCIKSVHFKPNREHAEFAR